MDNRFSLEVANMIESTHRRFPFLSHEDEIKLFSEWKLGSHKASDRLILSHIKLMAGMARKLNRYGIPVDDLLGQAIIGMTKSLIHFDPERGIRLNTFTRYWIFESMMNYIIKNKSLLKNPSGYSNKILFFGLSKAKKVLKITGTLTRDDASRIKDYLVDKMASASGIAVDMILEAEYFYNISAISTDTSVGDEDGSSTIIELIKDESELQDESYGNREVEGINIQFINTAINDCLNSREAIIFKARKLQDPQVTLIELSEQFNISAERARQIENRAFEKVTEKVKSLVRKRNKEALVNRNNYFEQVVSLSDIARASRIKENEKPVEFTNYYIKEDKTINNVVLSAKRSDAARKANMTRGPERRHEIAVKANQSRTAQRRHEISLKSAATLRAKREDKKKALLEKLSRLSVNTKTYAENGEVTPNYN